jgi:hypothetical protein
MPAHTASKLPKLTPYKTMIVSWHIIHKACFTVAVQQFGETLKRISSWSAEAQVGVASVLHEQLNYIWVVDKESHCSISILTNI